MATPFQNIPIAGGDTAAPLTMEKRLKAIEPYLAGQGGRMLECGCGAGAYVAALRNRFGLDVQGIEFDQAKVDAAWSQLHLRGNIRQGDLQALQEADEGWDFALLNEVLEHVPDDRKALSEIHRILKTGGLLFLFSPNRCFPFETHGVYWKKSGKTLPHWIPFVPYVPVGLGQTWFRYWARNYWPGELASLVGSTGFRIEARSYLGLTFENISGRQPHLIRLVKPLLRAVSNGMEQLPGFRRLGASQLLICRRVELPPTLEIGG